MQYHILSFEGPDPYATVGGLETRVSGLTRALADLGIETHLWFVGDPDRPAHELRDGVNLHRWCQWLSADRRGGVYHGQHEKAADYSTSLPPYLLNRFLLPILSRGEPAVLMAEEWQTANAVIYLDALLRRAGMRDQVRILWNANNVFGFDHVDLDALQDAARITTVSRFMKHEVKAWGLDALVIPNGLPPDAYRAADEGAVAELRSRLQGRMIVTKMARWDPDKRWLESVGIVAGMKHVGWRPLLVARGGNEPHGAAVMDEMRRANLSVAERRDGQGGIQGTLAVLKDVDDLDVVSLRTHVDPDGRRLLFAASDAVLANSSFEPFGLVGLETMAVGGIACTGCSGEDYASPNQQNALVLQTGEADEFLGMYQRLRENPEHASALRREGRHTAQQYSWEKVIHRNLMPRLELLGTG